MIILYSFSIKLKGGQIDMSFRDTHPKSLRQDFGLPNFVDGDVLERRYAYQVLAAFKILGLNGVYIKVETGDMSENFKYVNVDKVLKGLQHGISKYVRLVWDVRGFYLDDDVKEFNSEDLWKFDNFKLSPTLNRLYNN